MENLHRIKEVSDVTGEHVMTVYKRIKNGEIKAIRIGKRGLRIAESELRRWIHLQNRDEG